MSVLTNDLDFLTEVLQDFCTKYDLPEASADDIIKNKKIEENFVPGLKVGKIGIENSTDQILIGNYGIKRFEVNSSGKKIREISYKKETQGENLRTTIDIEVQRLAQKLLENKAGSILSLIHISEPTRPY